MNPPTVAVFGSARTREGSVEWDQAETVGVALARAGFAVATGGYGGTMEAVSRGARSQGGQAIGITAPNLFPGRSGANDSITVEVPAADLHDRIGKLLGMSAGCIALPGSIGTVTELLVAWNINHVRSMEGIPSIPVAAVGHSWQPLRLALTGVGAIDDQVAWFTEPEEAVRWVAGEIIRTNQGTAI